MSPEQLWVPGYSGPIDDLIDRIQRRVAAFAEEQGVEAASVEVELADGARFGVRSITAEPGYGFVTICPHPGDDVPGEVIVPVGSIRRIELSRDADDRPQAGFSVPSA